MVRSNNVFNWRHMYNHIEITKKDVAVNLTKFAVYLFILLLGIILEYFNLPAGNFLVVISLGLLLSMFVILSINKYIHLIYRILLSCLSLTIILYALYRYNKLAWIIFFLTAGISIIFSIIKLNKSQE